MVNLSKPEREMEVEEGPGGGGGGEGMTTGQQRRGDVVPLLQCVAFGLQQMRRRLVNLSERERDMKDGEWPGREAEMRSGWVGFLGFLLMGLGYIFTSLVF